MQDKITRKKFYAWQPYAWSKTEAAILGISQLAKNTNEAELSSGTVWAYAASLEPVFIESRDDPKNFILSPVQKASLQLIDVGAAASLLQKNKEKQNADELISYLLPQFQYCAAVFGLTAEPVTAYSFEEFCNIVNANKTEDPVNLIHTYIELMKGEDKVELGRFMANHLKQSGRFEEGQYTWEEIFFLQLQMQSVYNVFAKLSKEIQNELLTNYFYSALYLGIPVREALADALYNTFDPVSYVTGNKNFVEMLENNTEAVPSAGQGSATATFGELIKSYLQFAENIWEKDATVQNFVSKLQSSGSSALSQALSIYIHLKNADLIEQNQGGELTEDEIFVNDMTLLLAWFGIGESGAEPLINYFKQENPRVSVRGFIAQLKEIADLTNEVTIENIMEFTELAHRQKYIDKNQDLIIFHESDGQFKWNDSLTGW